MRTLILLRGVPGAGKTTFAELIGAPYFEADQWYDLFNEGIWDKDYIDEAHNWCRRQARSAFNLNNVVIVSNTSTTEEEVAVYKAIAEEAGARFVSTVVENRHGGVSTSGVPEETLQKMRDRFTIQL